LIGIEIENTGERVFQVNPSYFYVQDEDGFVYYPQTIYRADETAMPELQYGDLAPGDTSTGSIGFVVPTDLAIVRVYYQPFDDLLLTLVDFEAQGGETSSVKPTPRVGATEEETPESADAEIDCDEVEDWLSFAFAEADAVQSIVGMLMVMRTEGDPGYAELAHEVSAAFEDSAERLLDYELDPAAAELNENLAEAFEEYGDATEDLATAVDEGDEDAIAEASEAVYDAEPDLITAIQAITALAEECDVV
jgi:hypothetical protein